MTLLQRAGPSRLFSKFFIQPWKSFRFALCIVIGVRFCFTLVKSSAEKCAVTFRKTSYCVTCTRDRNFPFFLHALHIGCLFGIFSAYARETLNFWSYPNVSLFDGLSSSTSAPLFPRVISCTSSNYEYKRFELRLCISEQVSRENFESKKISDERCFFIEMLCSPRETSHELSSIISLIHTIIIFCSSLNITAIKNIVVRNKNMKLKNTKYWWIIKIV